MSWTAITTAITNATAVRPKPQATPPKRVLRAGIGSIVLLLGLFSCSSAPAPGEAALEATRFRLERRYQVEARVFRAVDETWYDSPWFAPWISDEVMVILRDPARQVMSVSRIFEDVDSGEHRSFGPQESCILPISTVQNDWLWGPGESWGCSGAGAPGPLSFIVELYEADSDTWNDIYECFVEFVNCGFAVAVGYPESSSTFTEGDELIGKATVVYTAEDLAASLPFVGDYAEETVTLGDCFDEDTCVETPGYPTGPEYTFSWRVTRLPDKRVFGGPTGPVHPIDPAP